MRKNMRSILRKFGFHIEQESETLFDVVCGMEFSAAKAEHRSDYKNQPYYFCSESCKRHFDGDPEKYTGS